MIDHNIEEVSEEHGLDPEMVLTLCTIESNCTSSSARYEDHYQWLEHPEKFAKMNKISIATEIQFQKMSWGMMQVMGGVARQHGYNGFLPNLCEPRIGLTWGCIHFAKKLKRYPILSDVVAAYNAGSPRKDDNGEYVNQEYVNKFFNVYNQIRGKNA